MSGRVIIVTRAGSGIGRGVAIGFLREAYEPRLKLDHVVRALLCVARLPLDANVQFMTVIATKMPLIGRE